MHRKIRLSTSKSKSTTSKWHAFCNALLLYTAQTESSQMSPWSWDASRTTCHVLGHGGQILGLTTSGTVSTSDRHMWVPNFLGHQCNAINFKNKKLQPFLNIAFQNICCDGYTQHSLSLSARGIVDNSLSVDRGNGWSGAGLWFAGGICYSSHR